MKPSKFKIEKPNSLQYDLPLASAIHVSQIPKSIEFKRQSFQSEDIQDEVIIKREEDKLIKLLSSSG
jgi:hypothetical protein